MSPLCALRHIARATFCKNDTSVRYGKEALIYCCIIVAARRLYGDISATYRNNQDKHVKAWLISSGDHWKDKTFFDLKQRCFYEKLTVRTS